MAKRVRRGKGQRAGEPRAARAHSVGTAASSATETAEPSTAAEAPVPSESAGAQPPHALGTALIAAFLLFQIAMPLRYYLGGGGYDERFSWRMFSSVRMQRCDVQVHETLSDGSDRALNLDRELQVAWIGMLERYRPQVVEKLLHRRCAAPDVRSVRFARACRDTGGSPLPTLHVTLDCGAGQLETREVAP
jgi:hypothetical protein